MTKLDRGLSRLQRLRRRLLRARRRVAHLLRAIRREKEAQAQPTGLSQAGASLIAEFEGFYPKPYNDPVGHCTIGYGTLLHLGPCDATDKKRWKDGVTKAEALQMLRNEADDNAQVILDVVQVDLTQNQLDALVSFAYNVGNGAFISSTLLKELNRGNYKAVPSELNKWVYASGQKLPGLVSRRKAEGELFTTK
jgi:lysozyme